MIVAMISLAGGEESLSHPLSFYSKSVQFMDGRHKVTFFMAMKIGDTLLTGPWLHH